MPTDTEGFVTTEKAAKPSVGYRRAERLSISCGTCKYFLRGNNACRIVEGEIQAGDVCRLWVRQSRYAADNLEGGKADDASPQQFDIRQLLKGTLVEREHTSDSKIAMEIAMDHLREDGRYYDKLARMESRTYAAQPRDMAKSFALRYYAREHRRVLTRAVYAALGKRLRYRWNEQEHPRDEDGQFTDKGGTASGGQWSEVQFQTRTETTKTGTPKQVSVATGVR